MTKQQEQVREFHEKFGCSVRSKPEWPTGDERALRRRLMREELDEFDAACACTDMVGAADALGDLLYVLLGSAVTFGIDLEPVFEEIHRSNMSKVWPDGTVRKDEGGKVIKPPTYSRADLLRVLEAQI